MSRSRSSGAVDQARRRRRVGRPDARPRQCEERGRRDTGWDDLHEIGTAAVVHKLIRIPDGSLRILVQGVRRIRLDRRLQEEPYLLGDFSEVPEVVEESKELKALTRNVQNQFGSIIAALPYLPEELALAAANIDDRPSSRT